MSCENKERDRFTSDTYLLKMTNEGVCQHKKGKRSSEGDSQTGDSRRKNPSEHGSNLTKRRTLTVLIRQRDESIRTQKEDDRATGQEALTLWRVGDEDGRYFLSA